MVHLFYVHYCENNFVFIISMRTACLVQFGTQRVERSQKIVGDIQFYVVVYLCEKIIYLRDTGH